MNVCFFTFLLLFYFFFKTFFKLFLYYFFFTFFTFLIFLNFLPHILPQILPQTTTSIAIHPPPTTFLYLRETQAMFWEACKDFEGDAKIWQQSQRSRSRRRRCSDNLVLGFWLYVPLSITYRSPQMYKKNIWSQSPNFLVHCTIHKILANLPASQQKFMTYWSSWARRSMDTVSVSTNQSINQSNSRQKL